MEIYEVGGAVRDRLLGRDIKDRDWVVVGATPETMTAAGFRPVGKDFPVFLHPETHEEYALARTERKSGRGYRGFTFNCSKEITLAQDLARRDLTINAMARDRHGHIIDPYGGRKDLHRGVLRHVTAAFAEDPLRVLRVARFAARFDFTIAAETLALMRDIAARDELAELAPERVWRELEHGLSEAYPQRLVAALHDGRALVTLLPELADIFDPVKGLDKTTERAQRRLAQAAAQEQTSRVRFAVLLADLAPGGYGAGEYGDETTTTALDVLARLSTRLRCPKAHREVAALSLAHAAGIAHAANLDDTALLDLLTKLDAKRRPLRFEEILRGVEIARDDTACAAGTQRLRRALAAIQRIDTKSVLLGVGNDGQLVRKRLSEAYLAAIAKC